MGTIVLGRTPCEKCILLYASSGLSFPLGPDQINSTNPGVATARRGGVHN